MIKQWIVLCCIFSMTLAASAQCKLAIDEYDEFDSTRIIVGLPVNIGYQIPSQFLNAKGDPVMIEEGKALFTYTENDSLNCFFLTLALAERSYYSTEEGFNVLLLLSDQRVIGLYNVPDKGEFDKNTNMRIYQHVSVVPLDQFYELTYYKIEKIRVEYKGFRKTLEILPNQQNALREAIRCVGEAAGLYPVKP